MANNPTSRRRADEAFAKPGSRGDPLRVVIYPVHGPDEGIDVTGVLVEAIALALWKVQGGNEPVNRLEAEMLLERALANPSNVRGTRLPRRKR
jgi:hypothetical protein